MVSERFAYVHCKPDGTPFYVGKGALKRAKYLGERNAHHRSTVEKYGRANILIGMLPCSDDEIAYSLEKGLIKRLRIMGVRLSNLTEGGDGGNNPEPETRIRLSKAAKKRGVSEACREACIKAKRGKPLSEEQKLKISRAHKGKTFSEQHRLNISLSAKSRGMSPEVMKKAWEANRGRVKTEDEKARQAATIRATLAKKKLSKETKS